VSYQPLPGRDFVPLSAFRPPPDAARPVWYFPVEPPLPLNGTSAAVDTLRAESVAMSEYGGFWVREGVRTTVSWLYGECPEGCHQVYSGPLVEVCYM